VLLQGFPQDWTPNTEWTDVGPVLMRLRTFALDDALVTGEMEYLVDGEQIVHTFESKLLTSEELEADLAAVGLRRVRALDDRGSWIEAVPVPS
jgi:hypothetical protein